jgi:hypothetical protein
MDRRPARGAGQRLDVAVRLPDAGDRLAQLLRGQLALTAGGLEHLLGLVAGDLQQLVGGVFDGLRQRPVQALGFLDGALGGLPMTGLELGVGVAGDCLRMLGAVRVSTYRSSTAPPRIRLAARELSPEAPR